MTPPLTWRPTGACPSHPPLAGLFGPGARGAWRRPAARLLRRASHALRRAALTLAPPAQAPRPTTPRRDEAAAHLEFHADAGAPEGALYVDGVLVGRLEGVLRL